MPLRNERRGHENQRPPHQPAEQIFPQQEAGFDRLPQPDLIGQQHPSVKMAEHLPHRFDLMGELLDAVQTFQTEKLVEPAQRLSRACS